MIKVGITGGIGSGKSTVRKVFSMLGVPTYDADYRAKAIINDNLLVRAAIIDLLGEESYFENGLYNSSFVAEVVFSDAVMLRKLNEIVHPAVRNDAMVWFEKNAEARYVIYEAAIMNAAGKNNVLDYVISVRADVETRMHRVLKRDKHRSGSQVKGIIQKQKTDKEFTELADFTINNNDHDLVLAQVLELNNRLLTL